MQIENDIFFSSCHFFSLFIPIISFLCVCVERMSEWSEETPPSSSSSSLSSSLNSNISSSVEDEWKEFLAGVSVYKLVASAVVTAMVIFFVLRPVTLRAPRRWRWWPAWARLRLDFAWAPVLGCAVLGALRVLSARAVVSGLVGTARIQPYAIVVIFFGLAYISISFDHSGAFEFLALVAIRRSGRSATRLFYAFWLVTSAVTVVASNDVAILTLTPIICHFARKMRVDPVPFLLTEFMAANIWSMTLFIGNPTNIIVGVAYRMSFVGYTLWMGLPAVLCGAAHVLLMHAVMRRHLRAPLDTTVVQDVHPRAAIHSREGAVFGCVAVSACILLLIASYWLRVELYTICGAFWVLYLVHDIVSDTVTRRCNRGWDRTPTPSALESPATRRLRSIPKTPAPVPVPSSSTPGNDDGVDASGAGGDGNGEEEEEVGDDDDSAVELSSMSSSILVAQEDRAPDSIAVHESLICPVPNASPSPASPAAIAAPAATDEDGDEGVPTAAAAAAAGEDGTVDCATRCESRCHAWHMSVAHALPTVTAVVKRMPWKILPFVLGMFVLVFCLEECGWVTMAARGVQVISLGSYPLSAFLAGVLSTLLALVVNNQPMTILGTMIVQSAQHANEKVARAWALGLIVGSNVCANFTIFGALAGIMFMSIVESHGVHISQRHFSRIGFTVMPPVLLLACATIAAELALFPINLGQDTSPLSSSSSSSFALPTAALPQ